MAAAEKNEAELAELRRLVKQQGEQIAALLASREDRPVAASRDKRATPPGLSTKPWTIKVRATRTGMYPQPQADGKPTVQHFRRLGRSDTHPGDEFLLEKPEHFSTGPHGWMELVSEPATLTTLPPPMPVVPRTQNPLQPPIQSQTSAPSSVFDPSLST